MSEAYPMALGTRFQEKANTNGILLAEACEAAMVHLLNTSSVQGSKPTHVNGHRLDYVGVDQELKHIH